MSPLIKDGDTILVDIRESNFSMGDIILAMDKQHEMICHRIIDLNPIRTKGDRNLYVDQCKSIVGIVTHIKKKNGLVSLNTNKSLNMLQAQLSKFNHNENKFRKLVILAMYIISLYEIKNGKKSVANHTRELEK
jgi:hypothetical protein